MAATCFRCGVVVDPLRDPARIVGTRIASFCRACFASRRPTPIPSAPVDVAAVPAAEPERPAAPKRRRASISRVVLIAAVAVAACTAAAVIGPRLTTSAEATAPRRPPPPPVSITTPSPAPAPVVAPALVAPPPRARLRTRVVAPRLPAGAFVHPLPGPRLLLPTNEDRRFGAPRPGDRAPECGAGHCGVDLGEVMGTPVVASRDGSVFNIVRSSGDRGGRWVQLRHQDDMSTYYMHLDEIRSDLRIGSAVSAGEPIGTLGRTGIRHSAPHLHFAVTMLDGSTERYIDPLPLLREATLITQVPAFPDDEDADDPAASPPRATASP